MSNILSGHSELPQGSNDNKVSIDLHTESEDVSKYHKEETFSDFMRNSRDAFVKAVIEHKWDLKLRTAADSLLICFDQMRAKIEATPTPQSIEQTIIRFGKYLAEQGWKPYSENAWENSEDDTASTETIVTDFLTTLPNQNSPSIEQEAEAYAKAGDAFSTMKQKIKAAYIAGALRHPVPESNRFPFVKAKIGKWFYSYKDLNGKNQHSLLFDTYNQALEDYSQLYMSKEPNSTGSAQVLVDALDRIEKICLRVAGDREQMHKDFNSIYEIGTQALSQYRSELPGQEQDELREDLENLFQGISIPKAGPLPLEFCSDLANEAIKIIGNKLKQ